MGPGNWKRGRERSYGMRRPLQNERREMFQDARTGEPPKYSDIVNPKAYRRELIEWVKFQGLADKGSSKHLTFGQRVIAITRKIYGNTKLRLAHVTDMVNAQMTEEEYTEIVAYILDTIDPVDRESSFLEKLRLGRI